MARKPDSDYLVLGVLLAIGVALELALVAFNHQLILFVSGDNWIGFLSAKQGLESFVSAWSQTGLGNNNSPLLAEVVISLIQLALPNRLAAEVTFNILPYFIATIGAFFLIRRELSTSWIVLFFGTFIFSFNSIAMFELGNTLLSVPYACAPIVLLFSTNIFVDESISFNNLLGLGGALTLATLSYPIVGAYYLTPIVIAAILFGFFSHSRSTKWYLRSIAALGATFAIFACLTLPSSLPRILGVLQRGVVGYATTAGFRVNTDYFSYVGPGYFHSTLVSAPYALMIISRGSDPLSLFGGTICALLAIVGILVARKREKLMALSLILVDLFFMWLVFEIIGSNAALVDGLYSHIPFLVPFNGANVYSVVLGYFGAFLTIVGVSVLANSRGDRGRLLRVAALILAVLVSVAILPNVVATVAPPGSAYSKGTYGYIPPDIVALSERLSSLRSNEGQFRVLWLPQWNLMNGILYNFDPSSDFEVASLANNPSLVSTLKSVTLGMSGANSTDVGLAMAQMGFRYVVVVRNLPEEPGGGVNLNLGAGDAYLSGGPEAFNAFFMNSSEFKLLQNDTDYSLYQNDAIPPSPSISGIFWLSNDTTGSWLNDNSTLQVTGQNPFFSPSDYTLRIDSAGPVWLIYSANYDAGWVARSNGEVLNHTTWSGWASAYYVPGVGSRSITLQYTGQVTSDKILALYGATLVGLLLFFILNNTKGAKWPWNELGNRLNRKKIRNDPPG
jgi:hypothetical protein